jgi:hypothetical protein
MMTVLAVKGLRSATICAVEFEAPLGPRGTSMENKVSMWEVRLTNLDQGKPDFVSRHVDPDIAWTSACALFSKQRDVKPRKAVPARVAAPELDAEAEALI